MEILGIDIGGSGIKGARVDIETGKLLTDRHRIITPKPSKPYEIAEAVKQMVEYVDGKGAVGCGFPMVIHHGKSGAVGNIDKSGLGVQVDELFSNGTVLPFAVINDAAAAGTA